MIVVMWVEGYFRSLQQSNDDTS